MKQEKVWMMPRKKQSVAQKIESLQLKNNNNGNKQVKIQ